MFPFICLLHVLTQAKRAYKYKASRGVSQRTIFLAPGRQRTAAQSGKLEAGRSERVHDFALCGAS